MRLVAGKISNQLLGGLIVIALLSFGFGGAYQFHQSKEQMTALEAQVKGTVLNKPRLITQFDLQDDEGQPFTNKNLQGRWSYIFFGFTNCGYICPMTMDKLAKTYALLQKHHVKPPQVIFVSVDPERDTTAKIHQYVKAFNPNFVGVRTTKEALASISDDLSVVYTKVSKGDSKKGNYDINHSGTIMLIDPHGKLYAVFSQPHDVENLAKDYTLISQRLAA